METQVKPRWAVIHPNTGACLCKDNKWRGFACFGTFRSCVKIFKTEGGAKKAARRFAVNGEWKIASLGKGQKMDAAGNFWPQNE